MNTNLQSPISILRSFRVAAWLGWQIESNWADPFLFAVYSVIKPLAGAAILVVMYAVIAGGDFTAPIFPYIYLGNAFYIYVGQILTGVSWAVVDDRERYKTLKYMVMAPVHFPTYLIGRGVAKFIVASISVAITILAGVLFLHVRIDPARVDWPLFLLALLVGLAMLAMMGLLLAGITMIVANQVWFVGEGVAAALFVFCGAVFPLDVLPPLLRPIGYLLPITYWLELLRRSLVGEVAEAFPTLAAFSSPQLFGILLALALAFALLSVFIFRRCEHLARERGMLDMTTNY
jgi:ABC-2 type transport system permease protein